MAAYKTNMTNTTRMTIQIRAAIWGHKPLPDESRRQIIGLQTIVTKSLHAQRFIVGAFYSSLFAALKNLPLSRMDAFP
jgi:hypothetical protein